MRYYLALFLQALFLQALITSQSFADDSGDYQTNNNNLSLTIFAGQIGVADSLQQPELFGIEIQYSSFEVYDFKILPALGYSESQGGSRYSYINFRHDFWLDNHWVLTPMWGFGHFEDSAEVMLGHEFEFISGLELAYELPQKFRIGIHISHISNAGISSTNPGTETVELSFTMPILVD